MRLSMSSRLIGLGLLLGLVGCASLVGLTLDERFGAQDPKRFDVPAAPSSPDLGYRSHVQPILERRCVVCHGCYDAPCQLKLGAWEGLARGTSTQAVYHGTRLLAAAPSRLFVDAQRPSQWRELGFAPVLNERAPTPEANLAGSVLYRSLALKQQNPLPVDAVLGEPFDFSSDRVQHCPRIEQFDAYAQQFPQAGMPYGLPGLKPSEHDTITRWLAAGSPVEAAPALTPVQSGQVQQWEAFLNGASMKERLMSRYLYEHLFLGHLYFDADPSRRYFRLVRSLTPPGQAVQVLATRRPYDDPGADRIYYRLELERESILAKTHLPYALSPARMQKYRAWFLAPSYQVLALPTYQDEVSANPFVVFRDIPPDSRYRFMLDEAQFFIMNFIKGPVCRGQMAVNVIQDQFWVYFVDPRFSARALDLDSVLSQSDKLRLPTEKGSNAGLVGPWLEYAKLQGEYRRLKSERLLKLNALPQATPKQPALSLAWNGDDGDPQGPNRNAALTVFRHFDSASVVQGLVGEPPKTAWLIGYPLFERIYYLLVAGYDVYGNVGHQLSSRLYMDFLRMEGESNFLALLPQNQRKSIAESWYVGAHELAQEYLYGQFIAVTAPDVIPYRSADPQRELYELLHQRVAPALAPRFDLTAVTDTRLRAQMQALAALRGASLAHMPELAFLRVERQGSAPQYFTLMRNTSHSNVTHLLTEQDTVLPAGHTLTVTPGFVGAYPNAIYRVAESDLPAFAQAIASLHSESDYRQLTARFAVRRTSPNFWAISDALHDAYALSEPIEAGLFDYSRLENR